MNRKSVSVVISAWNEEKNLRRCLTSVSWADEIIVVDSSSTDGTARIAREFTPHVFKRPNNMMLNVNKNFGFTKATSDWILSLDADEEVPGTLKKEILRMLEQQDIVGFWIPRKNISFGKWIKHGLWWPDKQLRLFRRGAGAFPCQHVHEYLEVEGKTESLVEPYIHYNYDSISQFIRKMDTIYTESELSKLIATNYRLAWYDAFRFPISDFVKIYFAQEGYKDGLHGLVLGILQAIYSFVVFAKLWEKQRFPDITISPTMVSGELHRIGHEVCYWSLTSQMKEVQNPLQRLWIRLKRRYGTKA